MAHFQFSIYSIEMTCDFIDEVKKNHDEYISGEYALGRYAWILSDIKILDHPIPAKGRLGIWTFEE